MEKKISRIVKLIIRLLIGAFFISTAVLKLLSLDHFEIYIYSFKLFSFAFSTFVARCVIAAELLLGALLISRILYKPAWWCTMAMLLGFTGLLVYTALFRNDANCHCMGDIVQLNPTWSIVKNVVTMALLLVIRRGKEIRFRGKIFVTIALIVAALGVPFVLFPMDIVYKNFDKKELSWNPKQFDLLMQDSLVQPLALNKGKYIIGFVSSECPYCQTSAMKIQNIFSNNNLEIDQLHFFIIGNDRSVQYFKESTGTEEYAYSSIDPYVELNITQGALPLYLFLQDGKVVKVMNLRMLDDRSVVSFINKE